MGSIRKRGGKYYAEVCKNGIRKGKSCKTKSEAMKWIVAKEEELESGRIPDKTFADLLDRYAESVSPLKRSHKAERRRVERMKADPIGKVKLAELTPPVVSEWRDRKLKTLAANTVRRDWVLLNHACNLAVNEWHWLRKNPFKSVSKPASPEPRSRVFSDDEIETLLHTCGYGSGTITGQVGAALLFALETAMRAGEICNLTWEHVHKKHVHIPETKNGSARDVPLSTAARNLIAEQSKEDPVFGITSAQLDALFRKCRDRALLKDLHFHDSRRTALTRLSKKLGVMELAKISGHKDLRILQAVYYAPNIEDLSSKLD